MKIHPAGDLIHRLSECILCPALGNHVHVHAHTSVHRKSEGIMRPSCKLISEMVRPWREWSQQAAAGRYVYSVFRSPRRLEYKEDERSSRQLQRLGRSISESNDMGHIAGLLGTLTAVAAIHIKAGSSPEAATRWMSQLPGVLPRWGIAISTPRTRVLICYDVDGRSSKACIVLALYQLD